MPTLQKIIQKNKKKALESLHKNNLTAARSAYKKIVKTVPRDAEAWFMLGTVEGRLRNVEAAEHCMRQSLAANPRLAEAWLGLGQVLELRQDTAENIAEAISCYLKTISFKPHFYEAYDGLGRLYFLRDEFNKSAFQYSKAIELGVESRPAFIGYGDALSKIGRDAAACDAYNSAISISEDADVYCKLGDANRRLGSIDEAILNYQKSLEFNPENIDSQVGVVLALRDQNKTEEAIAKLQPLYEEHNDSFLVVMAYAKLCHLFNGQEEAIRKLEDVVSIEGVPNREAMPSYFELGRLYDAQKDYKKAFSAYNKGNRLSIKEFEQESFCSLIESRINAQTRAVISKVEHANDAGYQLVFIVGMPRSGTSLVEQILGCHPQVYPTGESLMIGGMIEKMSPGDPDYRLDRLDASWLDDGVKQYIAPLKKHLRDESCITDKMPHNFLHLGLISLLFPKAKVIHCIRDPLDTCLSCYFQNFSGGHPYSYNLEDLGFYYRQYRRLMTHWKETLDLEIMDLAYEDMVSNQEQKTRQLIEFLGMSWSDKCLRFYESERVVVTSSHEQVRRPIYNQSVARWKNYKPFIAPLMAALNIK